MTEKPPSELAQEPRTPEGLPQNQQEEGDEPVTDE